LPTATVGLYNFNVTASLRFIKPCSPVTAKSVPAGDGWIHEPKLDGYRLQVVKDGPAVRLYSRRGHDWGKRLADLAESLRAIPTRFAILDAELCLPGRDGVPNFDRRRRLERLLRPGQPSRSGSSV